MVTLKNKENRVSNKKTTLIKSFVRITPIHTLMETKSKIEIINNRKKNVTTDTSLIKSFMKIAHFVILAVGIVLSLLLYLSNIYMFDFDWKIPFIPIMIALQIVLLILAIKSRYKKL
jgi:hypothetical protein